MFKFTSSESFEVKSRGWLCYSVECPINAPREQLRALIGPVCEINGVEHKVEGVESFAIPHIRKGSPIAIAVKHKSTGGGKP